MNEAWFPEGGRCFPNVVLVGARASGKSRASRRLAEAVGWERVSTDALLEERIGSFGEFVERYGWEKFRDEESEVLAGISGGRLVVDCGGGIVERSDNIARLRALGTVYWMRAPVAVLKARLARPEHRAKRPPLPGTTPENEAAEMLERRTPLYREAAECDIWSTAEDGKAEDEAVDRLRMAHFGPRIALTVACESLAEAKKGLDIATKEVGPFDLIELRADWMPDLRREDLASLLDGLSAELRSRLIVTVRWKEEGGRFTGPEDERIGLLAEAARHGAGYIDLEYEADRRSGGAHGRHLRAQASGPELIGSSHYDMTHALDSLAEQMKLRSPDILKIATVATSREDVWQLRKLIRKSADAGDRMIGIAMGDLGIPLRVTAGNDGAELSTYAPPDGFPETAKGQLAAGAIRDRSRRWGRKLATSVPLYGVVGDPVRQSLSPPMHEAALRHLGIEAAYLPFEVPPDELFDFLRAVRISSFAGLNVTIPHKEVVARLLRPNDEHVPQIGAVNTIIRVDGELVGANTDWKAAMDALEEVTPLRERRATVLGAGGSARAVLYGLVMEFAEPVVMSRDDEKAAALAKKFGARHRPWSELAHAEGDILVNATPLGMGLPSDPAASPFPESAVAGHDVIFDLVFQPQRTALLETAAGLGKRTVPGLRMLVLQAAAALELWTGRKPPVEVMTEAAQQADDAR